MTDEQIAELIKTKLNEYFKNKKKSSSLKELYAELAADLNAAVQDKVKNQIPPQVAVEQAFKEFGDLQQLVDQTASEAADLTSKVSQASLFNDGFFDNQFNDQLPLVNEKEFAADSLNELIVNCLQAQVKILPLQDKNSRKILVREFMNFNNSAYYARFEQSGGQLLIKQGKTPFLIPLKVQLQIQVPADFAGKLTISETKGSAAIERLNALKNVVLQIKSGEAEIKNTRMQQLNGKILSGSCQLDSVKTDQLLALQVSSGSARLTAVTAQNFDIKVQSGRIKGEQLTGKGSFQVASGMLKLIFSALNGDLLLAVKSGSIKATLPATATYRYDLKALNGRIKAPNQAETLHQAMGHQSGQIGADPKYLVRGETISGTIKIS
jgi:hypothetical protein